jgi:nucleoside-diphosphate-sugar epimerase
VLGSSMVVYGDVGGGDEPWEVVTEQSPLRPTNLYGLTKVLSEDIARYCATAGAISTVAAALGMFVPETFRAVAEASDSDSGADRAVGREDVP